MTTIRVDQPVPAATADLDELTGDPGQADAFGRDLSSIAAQGFEVVAERALTAPVVAWFGESRVAYDEKATQIAAQHRTLTDNLQAVARTCFAYADTLADLRWERDGLVSTHQHLVSTRQTLLNDIAAAADETDPLVIRTLQDRATQLNGDIATFQTDYADWQQRVTANETLMRDAFSRLDEVEEVVAPATVDPIAAGAMDLPGAPGSGATPAQVRDWWNDLDAAQREALIASYPDVIGSTDGIPADGRDQANRVSLDADLADLEAQDAIGALTEDERRHLENAQATRTALQNADSYVDPTTDETPGGQLWLYDPTAHGGDGAVAIGVGDLDTAAHIATRVPGITTDQGDAPTLMQEAINTYQSTVYNGVDGTVASMFWLGYDAPDAFYDPATLSQGRAEEGGEAFADDIAGLRASRDPDLAPAHLTAIGHSYGSTTTAIAASEHDLDADDVVLLGSPGAGVQNPTAESLGIDGDVYVGRNSRDFVGVLGGEGAVHGPTAQLGFDPSSDDFGAIRFEAEDPSRSWHRGFVQHGLYFANDSESLYNIGRVVAGEGDAVNEAEHSYDPWWTTPVDPEWDREPTSDESGRSDTEEND